MTDNDPGRLTMVRNDIPRVRGVPGDLKLSQKTNVKLFRVYTSLWGTFNLGFAKMTKFD